MNLLPMSEFYLKVKKGDNEDRIKEMILDRYANFIQTVLTEETFKLFSNTGFINFGNGKFFIKTEGGHPVNGYHYCRTIEWLIINTDYVRVKLNEKGIEELGFDF